MSIRRHRQQTFYFAAPVLIIITFLLSIATTRTGASGSARNRMRPEAAWQTQILELEEKLHNPRLLLLRVGTFDPIESEPAAVRIGQEQLEATNLGARSARLAANAGQTAESGQAYYIIQYSDRILPEWTENLRAEGYEIVSYLANNAYIVRAPITSASRLQAAQRQSEFRWVGAYGAGLKVETSLAQLADQIASGTGVSVEPDAAQSIAVSFLTFRGENSSAVRQAVSGLNLASEPVIEDRYDKQAWGVIFATRADLPRLVTALASVEGVEWIEERRPRRWRNDNGVRVVQTGIAGTDSPLYRNGLTGAGQVYGTADSGLDDDSAQFKLDGLSSSQTLSYSVTTRNLIGGLLPVNITNPNNKVLTYYLLGSGNLIDNAANPNGGRTLDPNQRTGFGPNANYLNAVAYDGSDGDYHGTATTSVAVGRNFNADGTGALPGITSRTSGDGVAPDARIVFQDVGHPSGQLSGVNNVSQALVHQQAYSSGVRVHSNSYGPNPPVFYDQDAADIDDVMWRLRDYNIFYAAGNEGAGPSTVSNVAKNNIVVGATNSPTNGGDIENLASFSSHGPTLDGRLKPDIAAPGIVQAATEESGIASQFGSSTSRTARDAAVNPTDPNNNRGLALTGGTSFSSPMAAGGALLVRQYFTDGYYPGGARNAQNGFNPSNALVKAVTLNSGRNMTGRYTASDGRNGASGLLPNFGQGWGRIALDDALYFAGDQRELRVMADIYNGATATDASRPAANAAITTGQMHSYQLTNVKTIEPLRITLVWSDPKPAVVSQVALVNNLDLEVIDPQGVVYRGNANFANAYSQPANGVAFDNRNPVEAVYILSPAPGTYTVRVIGANVPGNGSLQVMAQPGDQLIDSNRQGYALMATGNFGFGTSTSTSVDAASFVRAAAPGQILAAFGAGFPAGTTISAGAGSTPLPSQLETVSVRVNGILAPLFFANVGGSIGSGGFQINYQLPYETPTGVVFLEVLNNGTTVASENLTVSPAAPGVFTVAGNGQGQAVALNQDFSLNGDPSKIPNAKPEARNRFIIVFANGQGGQFIDPSTQQPLALASGSVAPLEGPLYATATNPAVTIGGVPAAVAFSGLATGFVGLWQLNVQIPGNAPTGNAVPLIVAFGGRTSSVTTVAVN
jgi:uncharacterized protein (TIGR03437 family)